MKDRVKDKVKDKEIAVIGGGIVGLSAAHALSRAGFRVSLFEKGELHNGTSANSHRIIHGGLRYFQQMDLIRVAKSLDAKNSCLTNFSDLIVPLKCYLPVVNRGLKRPTLLGIAGAFYGAFSTLLGHPTEWSGVCSAGELKKLSPFFSNVRESKVFYWSDARMLSPQQLSDRLRGEFEENGGKVFENTKVDEVKRDGNDFELICADEKTVSVNGVVSTLGPWMGEVLIEGSKGINPRGWAKAFNLVLNRTIVKDEGVGFQTKRGQVLFFAPRDGSGEGSAIGTWYSPFDGSPEALSVSDDEISSALKEVNEALSPKEPLLSEHVQSVECGVLPMKRVKEGEPVLYGDDQILTEDGAVTVLSTKYTTFPVISRKVTEYFEAIF